MTEPARPFRGWTGGLGSGRAMGVDWRFVVAGARARAGLTQKELAARLGCTQHYISMLENSRRAPSVAMLVSLADVAGVRLSELIAEAEFGVSSD